MIGTFGIEGLPQIGKHLHEFASTLYPICRSITGDGVRRTLRMIAESVPLEVHEIPTGTRVFDWEVPLEWNIEGAWVEGMDGHRYIDFDNHNLHIVNYSEPVDETIHYDDLVSRLHSLPKHPAWIPYRTSYYQRQWGFCLAHDDLKNMDRQRFRVRVDSTLRKGSLSYGECVIPGRSSDEVVFFTHVCHPSLANDNASGMAIATALANWLLQEARRFTYRLIFAPGTIGSLCWLKSNEPNLSRIRYGLVLALLGDESPLTYKQSRRGIRNIDTIVEYALSEQNLGGRVIKFDPYGYDERQLCSPGFDLPVGRLTRAINGGFEEYHSSADDLALIKPEALGDSFFALQTIVNILEEDHTYVNTEPKGEPMLGKRGLYESKGGTSPREEQLAMLWILNQADGGESLLSIAKRSGLDFSVIASAASRLVQSGLLDELEHDRY